MAEVQEPRRPVAEPGTISRLLTGVAQGLKWLLLSLVFSILIEWIGMAFWWEEQGLQHSRQMLQSELSYLDGDFRRSLLTPDPVRFAINLATRVYHVLFECTHLVDVMEWVAPTPSAQDSGLRRSLHRFYLTIADFVLAAMQITQVFAVRLAILTLATPVFGLFALVALVDGLVRRDLRRWGGGRESSFRVSLRQESVHSSHYHCLGALPVDAGQCTSLLGDSAVCHRVWLGSDRHGQYL